MVGDRVEQSQQVAETLHWRGRPGSLPVTYPDRQGVHRTEEAVVLTWVAGQSHQVALGADPVGVEVHPEAMVAAPMAWAADLLDLVAAEAGHQAAAAAPVAAVAGPRASEDGPRALEAGPGAWEVRVRAAAADHQGVEEHLAAVEALLVQWTMKRTL